MLRKHFSILERREDFQVFEFTFLPVKFDFMFFFGFCLNADFESR